MLVDDEHTDLPDDEPSVDVLPIYTPEEQPADEVLPVSVTNTDAPAEGQLPYNVMAKHPLTTLPDTGEKSSYVPATVALLVGIALTMRKKNQKEER